MNIPESTYDELARRKLEGESYTAIRKELNEMGLSDEEIHEAIRRIDEKVLDSAMDQKQTVKLKQWYGAGVFLAILGLLLTLGASRGIILQGIPRWVVYIPFFIGMGLMAYGKYARPKPTPPAEKGPGRIQRKRPYK